MMLAVQPTLEFVSIPHNVTYLTGIIAGSEIGLHGNMLSVSTPPILAGYIFIPICLSLTRITEQVKGGLSLIFGNR